MNNNYKLVISILKTDYSILMKGILFCAMYNFIAFSNIDYNKLSITNKG